MQHSRVMSIDYGEKRIGVALSDEMQIIASQSFVIHNSENAITEILLQVKNNNVSKIVIGLPLTLKSKSSQMTEQVTEFAKKITEQSIIDVVFWDERLTSKMAIGAIQQLGLKKKKRQEKSKIDELAATFILQSYLDSKK
ncbi:MAG: Holliday junction resolvase RuvX [Ignavibacteria bacterium]|nr:Holliday junction resolvase RuvX [Bacteroidota bacterium]MSQ46078.1 Holliday junction resolvase RuvX [Ignavibacteria bacterium]